MANPGTDSIAAVAPGLAAPPAAQAAVAAPARGTLTSRLVWLALMVAPLAVVILAATLTPSPLGHGTHTQLGLPPCGFLIVTGAPCPGCGLTTAFAHMVRLEVVDAARANAFGVPLFLVTFAVIPLSLVGAVRGLPVLRTLDRLHVEKVVILLAVTSLLVWGVRIAMHLLAR